MGTKDNPVDLTHSKQTPAMTGTQPAHAIRPEMRTAPKRLEAHVSSDPNPSAPESPSQSSDQHHPATLAQQHCFRDRPFAEHLIGKFYVFCHNSTYV